MQKNDYSLIGLHYENSNAKEWVLYVLRTIPFVHWVDQARLKAFAASLTSFEFEYIYVEEMYVPLLYLSCIRNSERISY